MEEDNGSKVPKEGRWHCRWQGGGTKLRPCFRVVGLWVGRRPVAAILATTAFTVLCSLGTIGLEVNNGYEIWQDTSTDAYDKWNSVIEKHWPDETNSAKVIFIATPAGGADAGILAPGCIEEVQRVRQSLWALLPGSSCAATDKDCERSLFRELEKAGRALQDAPAFLSEAHANSSGELPYNVASGVSGACCGSTVTRASALKVAFSQKKGGQETEDYNKAFIDVCRGWSPSALVQTACPALKRVLCETSDSFRLEQTRSMHDDQRLIGVAVFLMILYLAVVLGRAASCLQSKVLLGFSVMVTVAYSLGISFGIGAICGVPFTQLSLLAIFVLLGVGIDDSFIINDFYDSTEQTASPEERLAQTLETVGPSVLLTSATDFAAFVVGVTYSVKAIMYFCISAAIAVFSVFLLQVSMFSAFLVLDSRRASAGRCDVLPCIKLRRASAEEPQEPPPTSRAPLKLLPAQFGAMMERKVRSIFRPAISGLVVLLFVAVAVVALYGIITERSTDDASRLYLPMDSYLLDFWDEDTALFKRHGQVMVFAGAVDLSSPAKVNATRAAVDNVAACSVGILPRESTWVDAFSTWRRGAGAGAAAGSLLQGFLTSQEGQSYAGDVLPDPGKGPDTVVAKAWVWISEPEGNSALENVKNELEDRYAGAASGQITGFVWAGFFMTVEKTQIMDSVIISSLAIALGAIALICFGLLPPLAAVASIVSITLVNVDLLGLLCFWDVKMTTSTAAILVLALGFSVDYSAHVAEGFSTRMQAAGKGPDAEPHKVMTQVLLTTGGSVSHAGLSTLLATCSLAFASTKGFRDIFKSFLLMTLLGLLHGLVLLPILLVAFSRCARRCRATRPKQ